MKKYLSLFVVGAVIGFLWDVIQGLRILGGKGESMYVNFAFFAIPGLLLATYLLKSDLKSTLVFWTKNGFFTWLALTPLFCLQAINAPMTPIWAGAVLSLEWLPITGSAVVLFRAWQARKQKMPPTTESTRAA